MTAMHPCLALIPAGRDLIAAQAFAEQNPLDRALRAYWLNASDARRLARLGLADRAAISAGRLEAEAAIASTLDGPYQILSRRGFAAAEALASPSPAQRERVAAKPPGEGPRAPAERAPEAAAGFLPRLADLVRRLDDGVRP